MKKIRKGLLTVVGILAVLASIFLVIFSRVSVASENKVRSKSPNSNSVRTEEKGSPRHSDALSSGSPPASQRPTDIRKADVTPQNAQSLLGQCKRDFPNLSDQGSRSGDIISQLCEDGHVELAWTLIEKGPGLIRTNSLTCFFRSTKFTSIEKIKEYLLQLNDGEDRSHSIFGLVQGNLEIALTMETSIIPGSSTDEKIGYVFGISELLRNPDQSPDLVARAIDRSIELAATSVISPNDLERIFMTTDAFSNWESIKKYTGPFDPKVLEKVQSVLARDMMIRNPSQTMDIISNDPTTKYSYPVLSSAIQEYYKASQDGANAWVMRNLETLDPATSQRIVSVIAQEANRHMEFETSRQWANRILNPEVRKQLLDQVDQREKEKTK